MYFVQDSRTFARVADKFLAKTYKLSVSLSLTV